MLSQNPFENNPNSFVNFQLDPISTLISITQNSVKDIKKEFNKLKKFYINHPDAFFFHLNSSKDRLEQKDELSKNEESMLEEINNALSEGEKVDELFMFHKIYLLDSHFKIFQQIERMKRKIDNDTIAEIIFYTMEVIPRKEKVSIGDFYSDGTLNTGSKFKLGLFKLNALDFILNYTALYN